MDSGFQVLDFSLCQWNLDSGFQSLVGFRVPCAVFRIPQEKIPRIPGSTGKQFPGKNSFTGTTNMKQGNKLIRGSSYSMKQQILIYNRLLTTFLERLTTTISLKIPLSGYNYIFARETLVCGLSFSN